MKRLMKDLGDLTGLDIVATELCAPVQGAGTRPGAVPAGAALARGALRWLGIAAADDGRCGVGEATGTDPAGADPHGEAASRLH